MTRIRRCSTAQEPAQLVEIIIDGVRNAAARVHPVRKPVWRITCAILRGMLRMTRIPAVIAAVFPAIVRAARASSAGQERDRAKIPDKYKWNLADLYPSEDAWRAAKDKLAADIPKVAAFKGTLGSSPARLADALDTANAISKELQKVYLYASLLADQDTRVSKYQGMQQEMQQIAAGFGEQVSFIEPEILKIDKAKLDAWIAQEPRLKTYQHYLERHPAPAAAHAERRRREAARGLVDRDRRAARRSTTSSRTPTFPIRR